METKSCAILTDKQMMRGSRFLSLQYGTTISVDIVFTCYYGNRCFMHGVFHAKVLVVAISMLLCDAAKGATPLNFLVS